MNGSLELPIPENNMDPLQEQINKLNKAFEELQPTSEQSLLRIRQQIQEMQTMLSSMEDALNNLTKG